MKLPKYLDVFGQKVPVKEEKTEDWMGYFCFQKPQISIMAGLSTEEKTVTLLHELGHAVQHRTGLTEGDIDDNVLEIWVENMANAIHENFELKPKRGSHARGQTGAAARKKKRRTKKNGSRARTSKSSTKRTRKKS